MTNEGFGGDYSLKFGALALTLPCKQGRELAGDVLRLQATIDKPEKDVIKRGDQVQGNPTYGCEAYPRKWPCM